MLTGDFEEDLFQVVFVVLRNDFFGGSLGDDFSSLQEHDPVGHFFYFPHVVRGVQHAQAGRLHDILLKTLSPYGRYPGQDWP